MLTDLVVQSLIEESMKESISSTLRCGEPIQVIRAGQRGPWNYLLFFESPKTVAVGSIDFYPETHRVQVNSYGTPSLTLGETYRRRFEELLQSKVYLKAKELSLSSTS